MNNKTIGVTVYHRHNLVHHKSASFAQRETRLVLVHVEEGAYIRVCVCTCLSSLNFSAENPDSTPHYGNILAFGILFTFGPCLESVKTGGCNVSVFRFGVVRYGDQL